MFVNSLLTTQMTLTKRNELFDKYLRPGNRQLNFPTVNDVIYEQCIGRFGRSNDVKLHTIQQVLLKGLTPLVILVYKLVSGTEVPDKKELSQTMLDSIALLATSSYSLSQYRRTNLKQYLKDDYQSLCTPKTKLTDQLFGDDVVNKIRSLTEGKKMAVMVAQKPQFSNPSSTRCFGGFGGFGGFRGHKYTIRNVAELVGFLNSVCVAVPLGRLFTKVIEIKKASALNLNKGDFNAVMRLSSAALEDIDWWGDHTQLFITHSKPFKPVACRTIARWIKTVLKLTGIDTDMFKAHSTRAASTSAAFSAGMPINDILKAAGWSNESVFGRFYQKKIAPSTYLGDTILQ
ncbi:unnamed protein product [Mytilus coruscus]|uniref:Tyr recombinase domain-containing protein n=1 Tax=Mytilus coruscus TaxID=42192 RepID=A0A6J8BXA6_MYTCO|nr:unnamed protein product [Mytilus coruscus]